MTEKKFRSNKGKVNNVTNINVALKRCGKCVKHT